MAVLDTLGSSLEQIEDVIRAARVERTLKRVLERVGQQTPEAKRFVIELKRREGVSGEGR